MKSLDTNLTLLEGYFKMLENLHSNIKLDLISRLSFSMKTASKKKNIQFFKTFGAWESNDSAEDIVLNLKDSRTFKRKLEKL